MPAYSVEIKAGDPPRLTIARDGEAVFEVPVVSGLASDAQQEQLSAVDSSVRHGDDGTWELTATAKSSLWSGRRFQWRFFPDRIEFRQFASGHGKLGRSYFLSNGVSNRWDNGTTGGRAWTTTIYADRYFSPNPNHANQFEFNIAMPQTVGFSDGSKGGSDSDFRPERIIGIFAPPPLFLAFHLNKTWTGIGIGAKPGEYLFPALEYTGSRYAGASFYVDYLGYKAIDGEFASPVLSFTFAYDPLDALAAYTAWLDKSGFSTPATAHDASWHHLPGLLRLGGADGRIRSRPAAHPTSSPPRPITRSGLRFSSNAAFPFGTVVIDDKWQQGYGSFELDPQKWPDMKGFVAAQHAKGRHVLLWVPLAHADGLPESLCIMVQGKCMGADVGKPEYEAWLRPRIRHLVQDIGVDGFKEDWVDAPTVPGVSAQRRARGHRVRAPLPVDPLRRNPQGQARRAGGDPDGERAVPRVIRCDPPERHLVRHPQRARHDAPAGAHRPHQRMAGARHRQCLLHHPEGLVGLHAGPAVDRHSRALLRVQNRSHPGSPVRRAVVRPGRPLAHLHRSLPGKN